MMDMLRVRGRNCPPHPGQGRDEEKKGVNGKAGVRGQIPEEEQGRAQDQRENHEGACRVQEGDIGSRPRRHVGSWCHEGHQSPQEAGWRGGLKACSPKWPDHSFLPLSEALGPGRDRVMPSTGSQCSADCHCGCQSCCL